MIKYFFADTPFECQISSNERPMWFIQLNYYYDAETYLNSIGFGKYTFCRGLPSQKMIDKVIAENERNFHLTVDKNCDIIKAPKEKEY